MTPSEEVRKLLDERGVEYDAVDKDGAYFTWWDLNGVRYEYTYHDGCKFGNLSISCANFLTPAQAIAATVGAGTCHYIPDDTGFVWWDEHDEEHYEGGSASDECGSASCDKCGYEMMVGDDGWFNGWDEITEWWEEDGSYHKGYVLTPRFKFCPNCGRRVVGE